MTPPFTIPEDDLVNDSGLSRATVRKFRGEKGVAWDHGPNGRVHWTPDAVTEFKLLAEIPETPPPGPEKPDGLDTATVSRKRVANQRLVLAELGGKTIKVFIGGHADRFWAPMRILVRPGTNDLWHWVGNPDKPGAGRRLPRKKGKW